MRVNLLFSVLTIVLLASSGCKDYQLTRTESRSTKIDQNLATDSISEAVISSYRSGIDSLMNEVLNFAPTTLTKDSPEGTLGNWCSDAAFNATKKWVASNSDMTGIGVDFTLLNNGGLRAPIDSGEVTVGDMYQLMPFENELVLLELSGQRMQELISYVYERTMIGGRKGGVPVSSAFNMVIDSAKNTLSVTINGKEFDKNRTYWVSTSDYLANGGDDMHFFAKPLQQYNCEVKLRDLFISTARAHKRSGVPVNAKKEGRIRYAE